MASDDTGDLPFEKSITSITRSGTTATVTMTAHGLNTNEYIKLYGITDKTEDNNGAYKITYLTVDTFSYQTTDSGSTNYTGTKTGTGGLIYGTTDVDGDISASRTLTNNQPYGGYVRKSTTGSPRFKTFLLGGTISNSTGATVNIRMVIDE